MAPERRKITVLGGGHGLTASLKAALRVDGEVTALVSVADNGGSSGRLRDTYAMAPPGDLRRCIGALIPEGSDLTDLLEYRFRAGELEGHALGNLLFVAAAEMYGSATAATLAIGELFGSQGRVLPIAEDPLYLHAELTNGSQVNGQVDVHLSADIKRIWVSPEGVTISDAAEEALLSADLIILGPGSLYTSVLAVLAPRGVRETLLRAKAFKVLVANLREQRQETLGMSIEKQVQAVLDHGVSPEVVIYDARYCASGDISALGVSCICGDLSEDGGATHSAKALASAIASAFHE